MNPLPDGLRLMYAASRFGGHFEEQLRALYAMYAIIPKSPIEHQNKAYQVIIHKWGWIVERTRSWLGNNRRLAKEDEQTILSA